MARIAVRPFRVLLLLGLGLLVPPLPALAAQEVRDVLGAAHVAGKYNFTGEDYLNEGADRLLELGTRVVKVWFRLDPEAYYPFNSDWSPAATNLVELARKPYYQELFAKPFTAYFLVVAPVTVTSQFLDGMTPRSSRPSGSICARSPPTSSPPTPGAARPSSSRTGRGTT